MKLDINSDIAGVVVIGLSLFMEFSMIFFDKSGILGKGMRDLLIAVFGLGAYILPLITLFIGYCYIVKKGKIQFTMKFYGIMLFILNTLLIIQMMRFRYLYNNRSLYEGAQKIYASTDIVHGGILSYIIDAPLYKLFGTLGAFIIYICVYIVSYLLITKKSLDNVLRMLKFKRTEKQKILLNEPIESNEENININNEAEKDQYVKGISNKIKIIDFMKSAGDLEKDNHQTESVKEEKEVKYNKKDEESISKELEEEIEQNSTLGDVEYEFPSNELLMQNDLAKLNKSDKKELLNSAAKLTDTLNSFGVEAKVIQVSRGPSVTRYELHPSAGVKVSKIVNLSDDIALNLASSGVRIEAPIPGKAAIGIEVPNKDLTPVFLREVIDSDEFRESKNKLAFALGKDIGGNCIVSDLTKMPHMLIAGATGSGKSVCINTLIISLLYKYPPDDVKLLMIDPKVVELNIYNGIPHLLIPVVTNPKKAAGALFWAVNEMTKRYKTFAENNVRNIEGYNQLFASGVVKDKMPWIVIIIDELADLMMVCPNDIEDYIARLAQMARAAGMHLVIATQRPSVDVITGVIKANIPSRISFAVSSQIDSRTILDMSGAEKLLGKGDMLFYPVGEAKPIRIQGAFISEREVENVVEFIKEQQEGKSEYREEILEQIDNNVSKNDSDEDELLSEAIKIVVESGQASTSLLQRRLRIGYNRAARLIEQLEDKGVISQRDGSKPRNILVSRDELENGSFTGTKN
ncbi:MAG: DNA translocase FtsK 4TM domain-containing protein [Bacillota bacterium]|nr:DNA translocase FtsK 4TM domain-containing protein [Bacillota bacterium]